MLVSPTLVVDQLSLNTTFPTLPMPGSPSMVNDNCVFGAIVTEVPHPKQIGRAHV